VLFKNINKVLENNKDEIKTAKDFSVWAQFLLFSLKFILIKTIAAALMTVIRPEEEILVVASVAVNILFTSYIYYCFRKKFYSFDSFLDKFKFILFNTSVIFFGGFIPSLFASKGFELIFIFPSVLYSSIFVFAVDRFKRLFFDIDTLRENPENRYFISSAILFLFVLISNYIFSLLSGIFQINLFKYIFVLAVILYVLFNMVFSRKDQKAVSVVRIIATYLIIELGILFSPLLYIYDSFMYKYLFDKILTSLCSLIIAALVCKCIQLIIRKRRKLPV